MKACKRKAKILFTRVYGCISGAVATGLVGLSFISFKTLVDKEKTSPFECGFDPRGVTRLPFCIKFFMVAVVFLVFDVEVALILPILFSRFRILSFLRILVAGAIYE